MSGNKAMASADGSIDEASANETTEILNGINGRTTLVEDLLSCANETSGRQVAVDNLARLIIKLFFGFASHESVFVVFVKQSKN